MSDNIKKNETENLNEENNSNNSDIRNIENSLTQYQGFYQYNRQTDEYRALHQLRFNDKLTKQDLYENARADYNAKFGKDNILNKMVELDIYGKIVSNDIASEKQKHNFLKNTAHFYGGF